jgi:protein-L-isoaspartate(D-aspartate) O-methyltransferase
MDKALLFDILAQDITDPTVLAAMQAVPREAFVPEDYRHQAYENHPLPIGYEQTISQPYVVARMTEILLQHHPKKVLEIGTGSGYQTAILAQLVEEVYTIERIFPLFQKAREIFNTLNYNNIHTHFCDGTLGLQQYAPYDAIIITAASNEIPPALLAQLKEKGTLLLPLGNSLQGQQLKLITKQGNTYTEESFNWVAFVPLRKGTEEQ